MSLLALLSEQIWSLAVQSNALALLQTYLVPGVRTMADSQERFKIICCNQGTRVFHVSPLSQSCLGYKCQCRRKTYPSSMSFTVVPA